MRICNLIAKKGEGLIKSEVERERLVIISLYKAQGGKNVVEDLDVIIGNEGL